MQTFPPSVRRTKFNLIVSLAHQELTPLLSRELVPLMRLQGKLKRILWTKSLKKCSLKNMQQRMDFHSPPHFPFHKNRYIYSEFLWKAGLAEKGPCTDLLSSEPSLGIPSLFFLHEARRKNTKVTRNKKTLGSCSVSSLGAHTHSISCSTETQNSTKSRLSLTACPAWLPPTLDC